jgi:hypothetical protein
LSVPRREPFTQIEVGERRRLDPVLPGAQDLDDLARDAGIPDGDRAAFVNELKEEIGLYRLDMLVSRQEEPSRKVEALQQVVTAARGLQRALALLPDGLRMKVEPDMIELVRRPVADEIINLLLNHPDPASAATLRENHALFAELLRDLSERYERRLPGGWQMPGFNTPLASLIEKAGAEGGRWEARVSRARSRRGATHYRDILARGLKALAMARSPKLAKDERGAEDWVARALDIVGVPYPDPKARSREFQRMFAVNRTPPPDPAERPAEAEDTKAEADLLDRIGDTRI